MFFVQIHFQGFCKSIAIYHFLTVQSGIFVLLTLFAIYQGTLEYHAFTIDLLKQ